MKVKSVEHMFNFEFEKPSSLIVEKAIIKVKEIKTKVQEREQRVRRLREEFKITDTVLIDIMTQARAMAKRGEAAVFYNSTVKSSDGLTEETVTVGAGAVNMLLTETDFIEGEQAQVKKLELIIRNLADSTHYNGSTTWVKGHRLTLEELNFLGF